METRLLVVDDDVDTCNMLKLSFQNKGFDVATAISGAEALTHLSLHPVDGVITDVHMEGIDGIELCGRVAQGFPDVPVVLMTGQGSMETAIGALRAGASDFVQKPVDFDHLMHRVTKALRESELTTEVRRLQRALHERSSNAGMVGQSEAIKRTFSMVERVAGSDVPVLVTGESGTGKELVARALHATSGHGEGPFVAVNCAALPANLLESELFGHVRGAFTDAHRGRDGLFLQASGGTIFLDEIGELPMEMQPKLLRALQERKIRPVGGNKEIEFKARIITATNRDLESEVEEGRFREDLFYRVNVVNVHVPPLRSRAGDILLLAQHFVTQISERGGKKVTGINSAAAEKMLGYDWPGNVRELENCMERAVALARYEEITPEDLPEKIARFERGEMVIASDDPSELPTLDELESRYIRKVMRAVRGNKTQAADVLGLARRTLYRRLEKLGEVEGDGETSKDSV